MWGRDIGSENQVASIDRKALDRVIQANFAGDWGIFKATAECFLEALPDGWKQVEVALAAKDLDAIVKTSHRLKGEAALFHELAAANALKEIETAARQKQQPSLESVDKARLELNKLAEELRSVL